MEIQEQSKEVITTMQKYRIISNQSSNLLNSINETVSKSEKSNGTNSVKMFLSEQLFNLEVMMAAKSTKNDPMEIRDKYNGKLDRYIAASAEYYSNFSKIQRNDSFDLNHLRYLENNITYIVTNDKMIQKIVGKFFDCNDFCLFMEKINHKI
jgi:hypothetical protein